MEPLEVAGDERQMEGRFLARVAAAAGAGRDVGFDADQRLDAPLARRLVKVDGAVEVAVVRDGRGFLAERAHAVERRLDPCQPVEQRELSMKVEMRKHLCSSTVRSQLHYNACCPSVAA